MSVTHRVRSASRCAAAVLCLAAAAAAQGQQPEHRPDHMRHCFDDPARYAKSFDDPARDAWQMPSRVIESLAPTRDASVADIGA